MRLINLDELIAFIKANGYIYANTLETFPCIDVSEYEAAAAEYGIDAKTMLSLAMSQIAIAKRNMELMDELKVVKADATLGRVCTTCTHYEINCFPLNPDAGCTVWRWRYAE